MSAPLPDLTIADAVAVIDEDRCIGCALCLQACPVDAIVGAPRLMHTVISASCTGCELCIPPCPVDCIAMRPVAARNAAARQSALDEATRRHSRRNARLERLREEKEARLAAQREEAAARRKSETIARAVQRARERLGLDKR